MLFFKPRPKPPADEPFFPWLPGEYSVGVARLDQDHQFLAELLNQMHVALIQKRDRAQAVQLLDRFVQDVRRHFNAEEAALEEAGYPELEAHVAEHQLLLTEAADLLRQFQAGSISGLAFPNFLKHWLIGHIRDSDRKYAACLRRKGLR